MFTAPNTLDPLWLSAHSRGVDLHRNAAEHRLARLQTKRRTRHPVG